MGYMIETDLGRFEAETEKEAKKALKAAQKRQAKIDAEHNANYLIARGRACGEAYNILSRKLSGKEMPPGWRIKPVNEKTWCCRLFWCEVKQQRGYMIETAEGCCAVFPYDAITHVLENGAGFAMAIAIEKQDYELFAVGIEKTAAAHRGKRRPNEIKEKISAGLVRYHASKQGDFVR